MKLQDGKLYETVDGRRFRVQLDSDGLFYCNKSMTGGWFANGKRANGGPELVREVEEFRWVPISLSDIEDDYGIYRRYRGHWQERVTVAEARFTSAAVVCLIETVSITTPHGVFSLESFSDGSVFVCGRGTRVQLA